SSSIFFQCYVSHPALHCFPTRRSSDLNGTEAVCLHLSRHGVGALRPAHFVRRRSEAVGLNVRVRVALSATSRRPRSGPRKPEPSDRKSTRLNSSHVAISYAVFCLKKKT